MHLFVTTTDALIQRHIEQIIDFMAKHRLPAMYQTRENVVAGGLMAYGASLSSLFRRSAWYVHRIFKAPSRPNCLSSSRRNLS